jgi:hypothetical protein
VRWISSNGGPLVAVPEVVLPEWLGADNDEEDGSDSDYDRASEVDGYAGFITVAGKQALVLGADHLLRSFVGPGPASCRRR